MTKKQSNNDEDVSMADLLGGGFALLQHGIDRVIEWGFSKMKETEKAEPSGITNPYLKSAATAGKKTLGFFGRVGESYYREYEELKSATNEKKTKK